MACIQTTLCCWAELLYGRACCLWNCVFAPCILTFWSCAIYCCGCLRVYAGRNARGPAFKDPNFQADSELLGVEEDVIWLRATRHARTKSLQLVEETETYQLCRSAVGESWLLSALACLMERGALHHLFETVEKNPRGRYVLRLFDGIEQEWQRIIIDDRVPCQRDAYEASKSFKPIFLRTKDRELYLLLIEKAFAKFLGGYQHLDGRSTAWALSVMTGDPARIFVREEETWARKELEGAQEWKRACLRNISAAFNVASALEAVVTEQAKQLESSKEKIAELETAMSEQAKQVERSKELIAKLESAMLEQAKQLADTEKIAALQSRMAEQEVERSKAKMTAQEVAVKEQAKLGAISAQQIATLECNAKVISSMISGGQVDIATLTAKVEEKASQERVAELEAWRAEQAAMSPYQYFKDQHWERKDGKRKRPCRNGCGDEFVYGVGCVGGGESMRRFVKLRNAWPGRWLGELAFGSSAWQERQVREALEYEEKDESVLWMSWDEFLSTWRTVAVVDLPAGIQTLRLEVSGGSPLAPAAACLSGCCSFWCGGCQTLYCPFREIGAGKEYSVRRSCGEPGMIGRDLEKE
ncbi:unnamed protein product [Effrenium voratum]|nr:unnamed protein product [Effrenium voratum]